MKDGGGWPRGAGGAGAGVLEATAPKCAGLTGAEARSGGREGVDMVGAGQSHLMPRLSLTLTLSPEN